MLSTASISAFGSNPPKAPSVPPPQRFYLMTTIIDDCRNTERQSLPWYSVGFRPSDSPCFNVTDSVVATEFKVFEVSEFIQIVKYALATY